MRGLNKSCLERGHIYQHIYTQKLRLHERIGLRSKSLKINLKDPLSLLKLREVVIGIDQNLTNTNLVVVSFKSKFLLFVEKQE